MSHLKLYSINPEPAENFKTDTLIESGFSFIRLYLGNNISINDVYYTATILFEDITCNGLLATTTLYLLDDNTWKNKINWDNIKEKELLIGGEMLKKLREISNLYKQLSKEYEVPELNKQEVLSYSSYLLFHTFLRFLDGKKVPFKFPPILKVLQRPTLDDTIRNALINKKSLVFTPNPNDKPCFSGKILHK
jgi:hypothetical protein